jgi:hypothetical protein
MYDAEEDAYYQGPSKAMDDGSPAVWCTGLANWNNTITAAFYDSATYTSGTNEEQKWIAYVDKTKRARAVLLDGSTTVDNDRVWDQVGIVTPSGFNSRGFGLPYASGTGKVQQVLSSSYDGDLPGLVKTWAKGYLRLRTPVGCRVRMALILDDDPTEHPIQTVGFEGDDGWRDVHFSALCTVHNVHHSSSRVRYKLYLENLDPAVYQTFTPEVDVVGLDFLPQPESRLQYHVRVFADDQQLDVDEANENPLSTREAIEAKLREYLDLGIVLFWPPSGDGTVPATEGIPVQMSDYINQPYRIDTLTDEVASEVSFNLLEVA